MRIRFKITQTLLAFIKEDLATPHQFAAERVGFLSCRVGAAERNGLIILADSYHPVADTDYVDNPEAGATMGPDAIRKALQLAWHNHGSFFHVHIHEHNGTPGFSRIDSVESARFVPNFWHVRPEMPHGALVFSTDSAYGRCWHPGVLQPSEIAEFSFVGSPTRLICNS